MLEETTVPRNPLCVLPRGPPYSLTNDVVVEAASGSMETEMPPPSPDRFEEVVYPHPETSLPQGEDASEFVSSSSRSQIQSGAFADTCDDVSDIDLISLDSKVKAEFGSPHPTKEGESFSGVPETRASSDVSGGLCEAGLQGKTNPNSFLAYSVDQLASQSRAENFEQSSQKIHSSPPKLNISVDRPLNVDESGPGEKRKPRSRKRIQRENTRDSHAKEQGHQLNEGKPRHTAGDPAQTKSSALNDQKTSTGRRQETRSRSPQRMINTRDPQCEMKNSISQRRLVISPTKPQYKASVEELSQEKSISANGTQSKVGDGASLAVHRRLQVMSTRISRSIAGRHGNIRLPETGAQGFRLRDSLKGIRVTTLLHQFMDFLLPSQQRFCGFEGKQSLLRTAWEAMRAMGITLILQSSLDNPRHRIVIQRSGFELIEVLVEELRPGLWNITPHLGPTAQAAILPAPSASSEIPLREHWAISLLPLGPNLLALPGISTDSNEQTPLITPDASGRAMVFPVQKSLPPSPQEQAPLPGGFVSLDRGAQTKNAGHAQQVSFLCRVCLEGNIEYIHSPCGHGSCCDCCERLVKCHMCKGAIQICFQIANGHPPEFPLRNLRPRSRSPSPRRDALQLNQAHLPTPNSVQLVPWIRRLGSGSQPTCPDMRSVSARLQSLRLFWRGLGQPETLAEAGFFADRRGSAELLCFHCGGGIRVSRRYSDPEATHRELFPLCRQSRRSTPDGRRHSV